jgi:hypothetical protein
MGCEARTYFLREPPVHCPLGGQLFSQEAVKRGAIMNGNSIDPPSRWSFRIPVRSAIFDSTG